MPSHKNYCISNGPSNEVQGNLQCMWRVSYVTWDYSEHRILIFHCKYFIILLSCQTEKSNLWLNLKLVFKFCPIEITFHRT